MTILEHLTYYGLILFSFFVRILPRKISNIFGMILGILIWLIIPIRKNVAKQNLKIAFPEKTENEINRIVRKSYQHFCMVLMDYLESNSNVGFTKPALS